MKQKNQIAEFRRKNYKIRVSHLRDYSESFKKINFNRILATTKYDLYRMLTPNAKGGETVIEVTRPDGRNFFGIAIVHPNDVYDKSVGISTCWNRLVDQGAFTE